MSPKSGIQRLGAIALALVLPLFALGGCESSAPTLPLPPPGFLTAVDVDGYATLSGTGATPEALILAYNEDAETGAIAKVNLVGEYSLRVQAAPGETVSYWFRVGVDDSPIQSAVVPP